MSIDQRLSGSQLQSDLIQQYQIPATNRSQGQLADLLKRKQIELDEIRQIARLGSWNWDILSNIVTWSQELYGICGMPASKSKITYRAFLDLVHPEDRQSLLEQIQIAYDKRLSFNVEHRIIRPDGSERYLLTRGTFITNTAGEPIRMFGIMQDITERVQAELERKHTLELLRESEQRFRSLIQSLKEYAIFTLDAQGDITSWNMGASMIHGYQAQEIIGKNFSCFYLPEDGRHKKPDRALQIASQEGVYSEEGWRIRKDGSLFWASVVITALWDDNGVLRGFSKVVRDMTARKQMETEMREMRQRLTESREAERLHLAQELHDGPIQDLYGLTYTLKAFTDHISEEIDASSLQEIQADLQRIARTLRSISGELRPPTLAPFGLEKAIRSHARDFKDAHPELELCLDLMSDGQKLPENVRLALYRIYQASLANVLRHAAATRADILLEYDENQVRLDIRDNGKGFIMPTRWILLARKGHLGLVGAMERAESVGGRLEIESTVGIGTRVGVLVPLKNDSDSKIGGESNNE